MAIFTRLVFNEHHWIFPSGHPWTTRNQEDPTQLYQHQYGFGYEEWLLNTRYHTGGYQYGFIQGLQKYIREESIDRVYLYSVRHSESPEKDQVFYVGFINDLEPLGPDWRIKHPDAVDLFEGYEPMVMKEIHEAAGDTSGLDAHGLYPNVRFKMDNFFSPFEPVPIDFPLEAYPGFAAYHLTGRMLDLFTEAHGGPGGR